MNYLVNSLRQISVTLLVGISFFVGLVFPLSLPAQAATSTPEATRYQVDRASSKISVDADRAKANVQATAEDAGETLQDKIESITDTVVQKLNLNEPISPSTKEFIDSVEDSVDNAVENVTGDRS